MLFASWERRYHFIWSIWENICWVFYFCSKRCWQAGISCYGPCSVVRRYIIDFWWVSTSPLHCGILIDLTSLWGHLILSLWMNHFYQIAISLKIEYSSILFRVRRQLGYRILHLMRSFTPRTHTYPHNSHITHLFLSCLKGEDPVEVQKISARRELVMRDYREKHCGEFANRSFTERKTHLNLDLTSA